VFAEKLPVIILHSPNTKLTNVKAADDNSDADVFNFGGPHLCDGFGLVSHNEEYQAHLQEVNGEEEGDSHDFQGVK